MLEERLFADTESSHVAFLDEPRSLNVADGDLGSLGEFDVSRTRQAVRR